MNGMRIVDGLRSLTSDEYFHKPVNFIKSKGMANQQVG